ncbi:MAG: PilZ domain-containing protein, partial [Pseudobdellovibrio sp.]
MKTRPFAITFFSLVLIAAGLGIPLQTLYLDHSENFFRSLTFLNIAVAGLCWITAAAVFRVHQSFKYLVPVTLAAVIFNNWWVGYVGFDYTMTETTLASFAFAAFCCSLLEEKARMVLKNPKLKWWHVAERKKLLIPVSLKKLRGQAVETRAFNISESGLFLQDLAKDDFKNYQVGEKIELNLHFNEILKLKCEAKIVRKTPQQGKHPAGLG